MITLTRKNLTKLLLFNSALLILNVVVFSNAFLKVQIMGGSTFETAIGLAVIFISVALFIVINLQMINQPSGRINPMLTLEKITNLDSCFTVLTNMDYAGSFTGKIAEIKQQIQQMKKKITLIKEILLQKFSASEISYQKFRGTLDSAETIMCANIRSIINKISAFDDEEYNQLAKGRSRLKPEIARQKLEIYQQYIDYVNLAVEDNDEILLRLDKLLLEISRFNSIDSGELENMQAVKDLDSLISDTRWYR